MGEIDDYRYILIALSTSTLDEIQSDNVPRIFRSIERYLYKLQGSLADVHSELIKKD